MAVETTGEVDDVVAKAAGLLEDPVTEVVLPMAAAWKAANLLPGLIANTMPSWQ